MSEFMFEQIQIKSNDSPVNGQLEYLQDSQQKNVVIFIHGSGESDRDATVNFMGKVVSKNYKTISDKILNKGFAAFRYDKNYSCEIDKIITDAINVTKYIKSREDINKIFIYAWSEGVRVLINVLNEISDIDGVILQSGIASGWQTYFEYILQELVPQKLNMLDTNKDGVVTVDDFKNFRFDASSSSFTFNAMILKRSHNGCIKFNENIDFESKGYFDIEKDWIPIAKKISEDPRLLSDYVYNAVKEIWSGNLRDFSKYKNPVLILHGINDGWVNPQEAVRIAKATKLNSKVILFSGLGHSLQRVNDPLEDVGGMIDQSAIEEIEKWLLNQL